MGVLSKKKKSKEDIDDKVIDSVAGSASLRKEIAQRYKYCIKHYGPWEEEAKEDYRFAVGDQWKDEDRQALAKEGRPCLTFNRIRPIVNIVSGYQRENSSRIKVSPEGGEDKIFSEVMDKLIAFIDKVSKLTFKLGYLWDDGSYVGKGFIEAMINYDKDPIRGELKFLLLSPYQFLPDPDFKEYDLNEGCRYGFKHGRFTKGTLISLFPEKESIIKGFKNDNDVTEDNIDLALIEGTDDDYGNRPNPTTKSTKQSAGEDEEDESEFDEDHKFTLKEYWRPKFVKRYFVINQESGEPEKFDDEKLAEAFASKQGSQYKVIERTVPEMWVADMVCGVILQDIKSPFEPYWNGYPIFRFLAEWAPNAEDEKNKVQGMVRQLKDPQREKNKAKSQGLHILNTQANSGWIGDEEALSKDGWKDLERMGSRPGITIKKKRGAELREILPKGPSNAQLVREEKAEQEFNQISNVNPDLLGMQEGTQSGRAIAMRVKQAVMALVRMFTNYRYTKEIIGNFILAMVPMTFDAKKITKVLGPDYMSKAIDKTKYPEGLSEGVIKGFLQMVKDNKYNVHVAEASEQTSLRYETFTELVELVKAGKQIPTDLIIDFMDLPNSEEVKNRIIGAEQAAAAAAAAGGKPGA